jgi:hypothetical protein
MAEATIDHLAADVERLHDADRQLAVDIRDITSGLASTRAEVRFALRIGGGLAALVLPLIGGLIWQAGGLSTEVRVNAVQLEKRMDRLELAVDKRIERVETRIDRLEAKIDTRFDQIIQRLDQVVPKPKP